MKRRELILALSGYEGDQEVLWDSCIYGRPLDPVEFVGSGVAAVILSHKNLELDEPKARFLLHEWDDGWGRDLITYLEEVAQISEMEILGNERKGGVISLSFWPPGERQSHGGQGRKQAVIFDRALIDGGVEPREIAEQLEWTWNNLELIPRGVFVSGKEVNLNYLCGEC